MRILLIDDHTLFRRGLRLMLGELMPEAQVYESDSCEGMAQFESMAFELVLLDLNMPGTAGLNALDVIKNYFPTSAVLVVSGEEQPSIIRSTIDKGAAGFLPKAANPDTMMGALRIVLSGGVYVPAQALAAAPAVPLDRLTERQRTVLKLALKGTPNKLIARELGLSEGTVKSHLSAAFRSLDVRNRTEALYAVAQSGSPL
ncbi:MAG: response regulator transcription factor [Proteobacteria bacterium]|nr:response regulator transcription factor [Pseudomonadota bacterium]